MSEVKLSNRRDVSSTYIVLTVAMPEALSQFLRVIAKTRVEEQGESAGWTA